MIVTICFLDDYAIKHTLRQSMACDLSNAIGSAQSLGDDHGMVDAFFSVIEVKSAERLTTMKRLMTDQCLRKENQDYSGSGGVSAENCADGFIPAFCDTATGQVVPSRLEDGRLAPMHLLSGLPREWAVDIGDGDRILAIKETVIAGFIYAGIFYTRAQAAKAVASF